MKQSEDWTRRVVRGSEVLKSNLGQLVQMGIVAETNV
jgi:hypothetical protein